MLIVLTTYRNQFYNVIISNHTLMNQSEEASFRTKSVSCNHSNDIVLMGRQSPTNENFLFLSLAKVYNQVTINYANLMQYVSIRLKS